MDNSRDVLFCTARSGRDQTGPVCHTQCKHEVIPTQLPVVATEELARLSCRAANLGFVRVRSSPVACGPQPALSWRQTFPHDPRAFKKGPRSSGVRREFCISSLWKSHYLWKDIFLDMEAWESAALRECPSPSARTSVKSTHKPLPRVLAWETVG